MSSEVRNEEQFEIEITDMTLDMTNIYSYLTAAFDKNTDQCPMVIVVSDLPDDRTAWRLNDETGRTRAILIKENQGTELVGEVFKEMQQPTEPDFLPKDSGFYYAGDDIFNIYVVALTIATSLKIPCPQIIYTANMPVASAKSLSLDNSKGVVNTILLHESDSVTKAIYSLGNEMRHLWQHLKHEKIYYADYKGLSEQPDEEELKAFMLQKAEVDADAYAIRLLEHILNVSVKAGKQFEEVNRAIDEKASRMAVSF